MSYRPNNHKCFDALYVRASEQAGFFTTSQARDAGFSQRQLTYYVRVQRFQRIKPRLYRLTHFPSSPYEDLFMAVLEVGPKAVVSHDSALALYDLSDALPAAIHLTVPRTTSRRHPGLRLHLARLDPGEVVRYAGLPVTTVPRTIADSAATLDEDLVIQAVRQALERGLTSQESLLDIAHRCRGRARRLLEQVLQEEFQP